VKFGKGKRENEKMERKIKTNGKVKKKESECERGKDQGKMAKCGKC
jgi:hypothetical protein